MRWPALRRVYLGGRCGGQATEAALDGTMSCRSVSAASPSAALKRQRRRGAGGGGLQGRIWMDIVKCRGSEPVLHACPFRGWGLHECTHQEDVGA